MARPKGLTREGLVKLIHDELHISLQDSRGAIDDVFRIIMEALEAGEHVKLAGFATLIVREKKERQGRDPKTGVPAKISARRVILFRPSDKLLGRINGPRGRVADT